MKSRYLTLKYWLFFIVIPIIALYFVFTYFVMPLLYLGIAAIILLILGERGFRYWSKLNSKEERGDRGL